MPFDALRSKTRSGVFISYARADGEVFAGALRDEMRAHHISVWQDRTGMEGGRDWWEQIRQALDHVEYMVLVMTSAALLSETVRSEWRYARQQGVCVYPVIAADDIDIQKLPRWMRSVHWYDLAHQRHKFYNDLNTRCQVRRVAFMADAMPADFVPRGVEFDRLKALLLSPDRQEPVAVTAALRGAGGYGKTSLARAICHDDDIQNAFDDGVLWVTLGEAPPKEALLGKLNDLIVKLDDEAPAFAEAEAAAAHLRELFADRDILLVIDDVWRAADLRWFIGGGARCARLITTRRAETLPADTSKVAVDEMRTDEAVQLLGFGLPNEETRHISDLARRLGQWPLLLKLGNSWLRKRLEARQPLTTALDALDQSLTRRGLKAFDASNPTERNEAAVTTLELSFEGLSKDDQARFEELAVFEEDQRIPIGVLERFWKETAGIDAFETEETCRRLFDESLLVDLDLAERFVRVHDAVRVWLIHRAPVDALTKRHTALLNAYRSREAEWHLVADDGYLHVHLPQHLAAADRTTELQVLLRTVQWMRLRLSIPGHLGASGADVAGLVGAYDHLHDDENAELVQRALRLSAYVLFRWPEELPLQLFGRLGHFSSNEIEQLCSASYKAAQSRWLVPLTSALTPPGALVMTLAGHDTGVEGALLFANDQQAISWSGDGSLKHWDLQRGELLRTPAGVRAGIRGLTVLNGDSRALSWAEDGTLQFWDLTRGELLQTFFGHRDQVGGAAPFADHKRALSWSRDRTLKVWDLRSGALLHTLAAHDESVGGAALVADDSQALSWSGDRTLKLWDLQRGKLLRTFAGHDGWINGATILVDGRRAMSWSQDGTIKVWDLVFGDLLHTLVGHRYSVDGLAIVAEGLQALSWSSDGTIKHWDLQSGQLLRTLAGHESSVFGVALSGCGQNALSWAGDHRLKLWKLPSGDLLCELAGHDESLEGAALIGEGRQALSWSGDRTLKVWDLNRGTLLRTLVGHEARVAGAAPLANDFQALSWSNDGTLKLWDLRREESLQLLLGHGAPVRGAMLLADADQALSWSDDRTLRHWDLRHGKLLGTLSGHEDAVYGAKQLADGIRVLSWSDDRTLMLWDLRDGALVQTLVGHEQLVVGAAVLSDDQRALSWSADGTLKLWDLRRGDLLYSLDGHVSLVYGATLLSNDQRALSWSIDRTLKLWDLQRGVLIFTLAGHEDWIRGAMLLAAGRQAISWSADQTLRIWDLQREKLSHTLAGHTASVRGVTLVADAGQALSWSDDGTLRLWDLRRSELLSTLLGHQAEVFGATLLANGSQAVSWAGDCTLKLWDLQRRVLLRTFAGHTDSVLGATVLADGRQVLSWSADRTCCLWSVADGALLDRYFGDAATTVALVDARCARAMLFDSNGHLQVLRINDRERK